jgi:hypothetical protein
VRRRPLINVWDYDLQVSNLNLTANLPNGSLASVTILATNIVSASNVLYTVAFAGTNTSGAIPVQFVAGENIQGNSLFTTNQVNLNVIFINQAPSFTVSTPFVQALEESPMVTNSAFLTSISVGPANQSGQTWTFTTVTDTNELATVSTNVFYTNAFFSVMPYITTNGTLYFAPQAHSYGTNSVTVVMTTSGSPTNGGVNSCTNHFLIGIIQTNHAPVIACPTQETLTEDGAPVTAVVNVWDYDFQSANLTLGATSLSNLATVSITGTNIASASNVLYTVVFTPGNNKFGTNVIQFVASEGALTSTNTLMLVINYVNQAPSFNINTNFITAGATTPNLVLALEESSLVTNAWFLTNILVCPPGQLGQGGQTWTFTTLTDTNEPNTNAFFAVAPYITTNGTLIFEPLPHSYGTNAVTVTMTTTGSTANGGHNSYTTNFFIGIIETNHAPGHRRRRHNHGRKWRSAEHHGQCLGL